MGNFVINDRVSIISDSLQPMELKRCKLEGIINKVGVITGVITCGREVRYEVNFNNRTKYFNGEEIKHSRIYL